MSSLIELPDDVWSHIALNLCAPDVLHFLSIHRRVHESLSKSDTFWCLLLQRDSLSGGSGAVLNPRNAYMIQAYQKHLPLLKWYPLRRTFNGGISAREGHLACVLKGDGEHRICIQGGFTDDDTLYVIHVPEYSHDGKAAWTWSRARSSGTQPSFAYGASWTALDDERALRFGGFQAGGYSAETDEVYVVTLKDNNSKAAPCAASGGSEASSRLTAEWELINTENTSFAGPRSYHTATLLAGRYLVVIGGMMSRGSILNEAILDTQTWTWVCRPISTGGEDNEKPSGRHGHSVVLDERRNRLVLFGGGSGSDLLRSGNDNSEVWELKLGGGWSTNLVETLPWEWSKIHSDSTISNGAESGEARSEEQSARVLSPAETLCLGRCHNSVKVSPDTALLLFGSGRPSTNGVIGYNLQTDSFIRPKIKDYVPKPRFTGVVAMLEGLGYLVAHGGYSSQSRDAIGDMAVLDLAPGFGREFCGLPTDENTWSNEQVTDQDAARGRQNGDYMLFRLLNGGWNDNGQAALARYMLEQIGAGNAAETRAFLSMHANGMFGNEDDSSDEENDNQDDYQDSNEMSEN